MERQIVFKALTGPRNYNLNIELDENYKTFVMPTFNDLYESIMYIGQKSYDIRKLPNFIQQSNLNFLEMLFSKDITGDNELVDYLRWHRFELSKTNLHDLYYLCINNSDYLKSKMINQSVKKGYDSKTACEAIRLLDFIIRLAKYDFNFEKALWYGNSSGNEIQRCFLMNVKFGKYDIEEIYEFLSEYREKAIQYKNLFIHQKVNSNELNQLNEFIKNYVKKGIQNEL